MRLADEQAARFYSVWRPLLVWINDERKIVPVLSRNAEGAIHAEDGAKIREVLWKDMSLLERFVAENPARLSPDLLAIAAGWRHRRLGTFYVWKHYQRHTVFLDDNDAYAVLGLYSTFAEILPMAPPLLVEATLLPFEGAIVHDGLIGCYKVFLGPGIRRSLLERYRDATARGAVHKILGDRTPATSGQRPRRRLRRQPDLTRQRDGRM